MRPGVPPEPTKLRAVRGNPGRRPLNQHEPKPKIADSTIPRDLPLGAAEIWREVVSELVRIGLVAVVDRCHLARACRLESLGRGLLATAEQQPVIETKNNGKQISPELASALKCFRAADEVWFRFGITPSERSRIAVGGASEEDPLAAFIARR
jgi:phage terminase small subunit